MTTSPLSPPKPALKPTKDKVLYERGRFRLSYAWYDLWVGAFVDTKQQRVYICLFPGLLITISK
jgi:hypothetical protein